MDVQCYYLLLLYTGAYMDADVLECSLQPSEEAAASRGGDDGSEENV